MKPPILPQYLTTINTASRPSRQKRPQKSSDYLADTGKNQYNDSQQNNKGGVFGAEKEKKQVPEDDHHQRLGHDHHYRFRRCSGCPSKFTIDLNRSHLILKAAVCQRLFIYPFSTQLHGAAITELVLVSGRVLH